MVDPEAFTSKPGPEETAGISNRLSASPKSVTVAQLAEQVAAGHTFCPAIFRDGRRSTEDWKQQQVFALDFDHGYRYEQFEQDSAACGLTPVFTYATYSHTEAAHRFRAVFALNKPVETPALRELVQLCLMKSFPKCDSVCRDAARMFYGGTKLLSENHTAMLGLRTITNAQFPYLNEDFDFTIAENLEPLLAQLDARKHAPAERVNAITRLISDERTDSPWREFKEDVAQALTDDQLGEIYQLTGKLNGEWLVARDPSSPTGDQNASAGVANGSGRYIRGHFKSFRNANADPPIGVLEYLLQYRPKEFPSFTEAAKWLSAMTGVSLPVAENEAPETSNCLERVDLSCWNTDEVPEPEWVIENLLERKNVGALVGDGGIGKGWFLLELCIGAVTGRTIFPSFPATKPIKVMYLAGEDSSNQLHTRYQKILKTFELTGDERQLVKQNLYLCAERDGPLVVNGSKGVTTTELYGRVQGSIKKFRPDLLVIDPKSRWSDLCEDSNAEQTRFVQLIVELVRPCNAAALISHHVGKQGRNEMNSAAARGASAFTHAVRVQLNMVYANASEAGLRGHNSANLTAHNVVKMDTTKCNSGAGLPAPVYLQREPNGVLKQLDGNKQGNNQRLTDILNGIVEWLKANPGAELSTADIRNRTKPSEKLRTHIGESHKASSAELSDAVQLGLDNGLLAEKRSKCGKKPRLKVSGT